MLNAVSACQPLLASKRDRWHVAGGDISRLSQAMNIHWSGPPQHQTFLHQHRPWHPTVLPTALPTTVVPCHVSPVQPSHPYHLPQPPFSSTLAKILGTVERVTLSISSLSTLFPAIGSRATLGCCLVWNRTIPSGGFNQGSRRIIPMLTRLSRTGLSVWAWIRRSRRAWQHQ